jgi:hypothetical protein
LRNFSFKGDCIIGYESDPANRFTPLCRMENHTNFFGESEIIDIIHYHHGDYKERYHEMWTGYPLSMAGKEDMDSWAIADGFPKGFVQAYDWFKATTGNVNWHDLDLDVIVWQKDDIMKRWQK